MTPEQKRVYDGVQSGRTVRQMAEVLCISFECAKSRYKRAKKWMEADPSAQSAASASGANVMPHSYWIKKDGVSAYFQTPKENETDDLLERVASAFAAIPAYNTKPVTLEDNDLLVVYPMYDLHAGMLADSEETRGPDYDLTLFKSDLLGAVARLNSRVPSSGHALIILGGDTLHTNDYTNETPGHAHKLDADSRFEKITDIAIEAISHAIEEVASRHARVSVVVIRGNHDESSHIVLKAALKQRYRNTPRIQFPVLNGAARSEIFWHQHGRVMIAAHHGDKMKPETLAMICADQCRFWSDTRTRVILTGHRHHLRVQDMPGVSHYTMRAFAPADAYGANFGGVRGLQAMVFDSAHGLIAQFHDGIWRE
jgi:predicted phosphodiesterase